MKLLFLQQSQVNTDSQFICQGLQEERFRAERLEEQVNDLTELHQAETGNLKQALADAEEKLSYQSEERLRDLAEMLEACQTKVRIIYYYYIIRVTIIYSSIICLDFPIGAATATTGHN